MMFCRLFILIFAAAAVLLPAAEPVPPADAGLNSELGLALFPAAGTIWEEDFSLTARRLAAAGMKMPPPGAGLVSVSAVFPEKLTVFGARVRELRLVTEKRDGGNHLVQIDLIFANKGDSAGEKRLKSAIRREGRSVENALQARLGPAGRMTYGPRELDLKVDCRRSAGTLWLLENVRREYTILHLCPPDTGNSVTALRPAAELKKNVQRSEPGDIRITGVPMVNQGPKGYCLPAVLERLLLYYGVRQLNMHRIADLAGTERGGGTTIDGVNGALDILFRRRHIQVESGRTLEPSKLAKYLQAGVPVLWLMFYSDKLGDFRRRYTLERSRCGSVKELRKLARSAENFRGAGEAHACLIVGINEKSGEIAVSDSWGGNGNPEWLPLKTARAVSQRTAYFVYLPPR